MKTLRSISIILLAASVLASCKKDELNGSGQIVSQERNLPEFENVIIKSVVETNISYGTEFSVTVRTDAVAVNRVHTHVNNNTLSIDLDENINYQRIDFEVDVVMPFIDMVENRGVSNSSLQGFFNMDEIRILHDGVGDFTVSGSASVLDLNHNGVGDLHANNFSADICHADHDGVGNMYLSVNDELDGSLSGVGNIYYQGNPVVNVVNTGVGNVIHVN